ncbi:hypothetical protein, partial [Draconibacterium mangrovi]|uniref:hypothetical protein n=1 Tax=Draconibacterium mangrovi TaxID=2697469 RepID=UPI00195379E9
ARQRRWYCVKWESRSLPILSKARVHLSTGFFIAKNCGYQQLLLILCRLINRIATWLNESEK